MSLRIRKRVNQASMLNTPMGAGNFFVFLQENFEQGKKSIPEGFS
jgi:hypothetical protein